MTTSMQRSYSQRRVAYNRRLARESAIAVCDLLQAAMFHLAHGQLGLAVVTVRKTQAPYELCRRSSRHQQVPAPIDMAYRAGFAWIKDVRSHRNLAVLCHATNALVEWRAVTPDHKQAR